MSKIFDNINVSFETGLKQILENTGVIRADFCVGYFNLRGWRQVMTQVDALPGDLIVERVDGKMAEVHRTCRLLIGMHRQPSELVRKMFSPIRRDLLDNNHANRWRTQVLEDLRKQLTYGIQTQQDEEALQKLKEQLSARKVVVKLHLRNPLHAKLSLTYRPKDTSSPLLSLMGSSNLTFSGLSKNGELDAEFGDPDDGEKFKEWFENRWEDTFSLDITEDLCKILDECWASANKPTPYEIYLKIMYNLSREARGGVSEFHLPHPFDKDLYDFQKTAVKLVLRHLKRRGGAMLGDVVGLGKTITACAVAKYYEASEGFSTLILCPPNLVEMWKSYVNDYDLKAVVRSIAQKFNPKTERYFKLVIVDESHNLRNGTGSRYSNVKELLQYQQNDVLLLTATPYNKDYSDIKNQLRLFLEEDIDIGIRPECAIAAAGGEMNFVQAHPNMLLSSLKAFGESEYADDWKDLLKYYLVRRTRTFIKENYALADEENPKRKYLLAKDGVSRNYFPDRIPKKILFKTVPNDMFERLYNDEMMAWMGDLKLPRYGLSKYLSKAKVEKASENDKAIIDTLSSAGKRLMGFCRSGFCKRMDSSGVSFLMSLYRHAVRNAMFLYAIAKKKDFPLHVGTDLGDGWVVEGEGDAVCYSFPTEISEYLQFGEDEWNKVKAESSKSVRWISSTYFTPSLKKVLLEDLEIVLKMIEKCGTWLPHQDEKLNALYDLVTKAHASEKILIFTQYSDTARYIADQLKERNVNAVAQVDGDTVDVVSQVNRFSPRSNKVNPFIPEEQQTRILIATDTLSEGQNLQDAHIVVNYDLPWAIIRLIQRAGRVDRIGQKAAEVWCYSFFPQEGIDTIINLKNRLNQRINANANAIGSDEIFFEGNEQNLRDIFNEKAGVLDDEAEDDEDVDIPSKAYQIWEEATKQNKALAKRIMELEDVVYTTKFEPVATEGVITYIRTDNDNDSLTWVSAKDGRIHSRSITQIFNALACTPETPVMEAHKYHHEMVATALKQAVNEKMSSAGATIGTIGTKNSIRYKVFNLLQNRVKEEDGSLFEDIYKRIAEQVYKYPLRDIATSALRKMFARHETASAILKQVTGYYEDNALCVTPEESAQYEEVTAKIICSLGLRKQ
ncbi:MAG: helicase [Kiritimatiellae bacterium]|nr:helicase [Kiritimatiellia bacterium]